MALGGPFDSAESRNKSQRYADFLPCRPQQALAASQHLAPSMQHFWTAAQQSFFSAQHFVADSQHPSLASATQQADASAQQASFFVQQLATFTAAFVGPQHALASLQHAKPSVQHFCTAAQQPLFSAQHFMPFSQQPSFASASQQALLGVQQARLAEQQSFGCASATVTPANSRPRARSELANSLVNMNFSNKRCRRSGITAQTVSAARWREA
jgi:hypothetical protein